MTMILANQVDMNTGDITPIFLNTRYVRHFTPIKYPPPCVILDRKYKDGTQCQMEHASAVVIDLPFEGVVRMVEEAHERGERA